MNKLKRKIVGYWRRLVWSWDYYIRGCRVWNVMVNEGDVVVERPFFDPYDESDRRSIFCGAYFNTKKGVERIAVDIASEAGAYPWTVICAGQWDYGILHQDEVCPPDFWVETKPIWAWSYEEALDILGRKVGEP